MRFKKSLNNLALSFLAITLVFFMGLDFLYADNDDYYPEEGSSKSRKFEPQLELNNAGSLGEFTAGENSELEVRFENVSHYSARNLVFEIIADDRLASMFESKRFMIRGVDIYAKKDHVFKLPFKLKESAPEGVYKMKIKLNYQNNYKNTYEKSYEVFMYVKNDKLTPTLVVLDEKFTNTIVSSDTPTDMVLNIANKGDLEARNINIELKNLDPKAVYLYQDSSLRKIKPLAKGAKENISFKLKAHPDLDKDYELDLVIKYLDGIGSSYEKHHKILVPCSNEKKAGELSSIKMNFSQAEYPVASDQKRKIALTLKNTSASKLENLKLQLSGEGVTFMSKYIHLIDKIEAGQSKTFAYTVMLADSESKGAFPITANLSSTVNNEEGKAIESEMQVTSLTSNGNDNGGKKPKIIIADYSISGEKVVAGKEFTLTIHLKNTSRTSGVKNVKVTHSSEEEIFIPIDAANSFFIENIPPDSSVSKAIRLTSKPDAKAKMYKMTFSAEYEDNRGKSYDEKGNPYKSEEAIVLNLTQQIRLEVQDLEIAESAMVGEDIPIDVEFYNMGKAPLYNMMVKLEGEDFDSDTKNYFVGNFEASSSDMFSSKIIPTKEGKLKGKLLFEFEDESGNKNSVEKKFEIDVAEGPSENGMNGDMNIDGGFEGDGFDPQGMEYDENGNPIPKDEGMSFIWIVVIAIALIIAFIVFMKVRKKRKKKKLEKLLLEEDDEIK